MATKTFKIGLSATDKQNMAQDIYEQVEELLFEEYDSTKTYNENDYVVYSGVLYRALVDNITGTWDGTKWQSATLNDLVDEVNSAVESVDDKANVNGNYPTMTVGLADNLTPYGEDSGAEQDNPFISNGTGTNNNTGIVTVGDYGLLREKQGNTIVFNNLVNPDNYANVSSQGYTTNGITFTKQADGSILMNGTCTGEYSSTGVLFQQELKAGHIYLFAGSPSGGENKWGFGFGSGFSMRDTGNGYIYTPSVNATNGITFYCINGITFSNKILRPQIIDLTQMFDSNDNIPPDLLNNPSHFSWYYNGSLAYNTGSLENANGVKLVSTGRNLWDEEWEVGLIDNTTGQNESNANAIRSKNYINIVPNVDYYFKVPIGTSNWFRVCWYDKNKTFISGLQTTSFIQKSPANAYYMRFCSNGTYGNTYLNDITISLYYTQEQGGEGYSTYYPYEEPNVIDTGSEVLRSAGNVRDYKEPNGTIHRLVGSVDLSTLSWTQGTNSGGLTYYEAQLPSNAKAGVINVIPNIVAEKYVLANGNRYENAQYGTFAYSALYITIYTQSSPTGTLYYELATPTTEQGTAFSKNLPINDYGMLYWLDEDNELVGISQGAKIMFPVNYKGFTDDMYSRVEGDSSKYVIDTDLAQYVKQEDLSSQIIDVAGLTYNVKKAYKTGNLCVVSIMASNSTGSAIPHSTTLFNVPTSMSIGATYMVCYGGLSISGETKVVIYTGNIYLEKELKNGESLTFTMTYLI